MCRCLAGQGLTIMMIPTLWAPIYLVLFSFTLRCGLLLILQPQRAAFIECTTVFHWKFRTSSTWGIFRPWILFLIKFKIRHVAYGVFLNKTHNTPYNMPLVLFRIMFRIRHIPQGLFCILFWVQLKIRRVPNRIFRINCIDGHGMSFMNATRDL